MTNDFSVEQQGDQMAVAVVGILRGNDSDHNREIVLEVDPVLAYTDHIARPAEVDTPDHNRVQMDADNQAEHWAWVLHTLGDCQVEEGKNHRAGGMAVLLDTGLEEDNPPGSLENTDLGDTAGDILDHRHLGTAVR